MSNKYKIAFLLGYPEISGGTNVIMEHAVGLSKLGHEVYIVTEIPFDKQRLSWHPEAMQLECLSHEQCRGILFDISIATWWRSVYDLPFVRARRYAYFCQSIESRFFSEKDPDMKALAEFTYRLPYPVVTEATWIMEYLRNHYGSDVTLVRNGIKKDIFTMNGPVIDDSRPLGLRVLVEGPLGVPFKKVEETVALCQQAGVKDIWLLTSTPTSEYKGVSRLFSKVPMKEVPSIYRSCDVLVKLSIVEGMFGPPLEIMHCGGTAITSNVTGHDEYMKHYDNGIVVPMGDDQQVIKELRSLLHDDSLLTKLKTNAVKTANEWPSWEVAVKEMEKFLVNQIEKDIKESDLEHVTMNVLIASLKLAGPLHAAINRSYNKKELALLFQEGLKRFVKREFPGVFQKIKKIKNTKEVIVEQELPPFPKKSSVDSKVDNPLVCFVGDKRRHFSTVPSSSSNLRVSFVHVEHQVDDSIINKIKETNPDYCIIYDLNPINTELLERIPSVKFLVMTKEMKASEIDRLQKLKDDVFVVHVNSKIATSLHSKHVRILSSISLPINSEMFLSHSSLSDWLERKIPLLIIGSEHTEQNKDWFQIIENFEYLHVNKASDEKLLAPLLKNSKVVLYLPSIKEDYLMPTYALRDMTSGCLVIAPKFESNYTFMPGEHYLSYDNVTELERILNVYNTFPDSYDIVRRVGMEKSKEFLSSEIYLNMINSIYKFGAAND
ncbi:glycosyltransferase family 4 protein [Paenibacillus ehimensis]|uniref:glycosyltransferase family 4 protein n=1 Tax=Paenibacillus ehimensis TaxID=79264 RepID=UPI002DB8F27B|nr:glycosyltransferase family 4 protein [Paenibacillus ehimensis]MEC0213255.1 glycosyltransferase family 4 protein [Paenibacillus ehimensis]